jgi:hypothetical protein
MTPAKRPIVKHGNDRWEVDFGVDATGKKKRLTVETEAEADAVIDKYHKDLKQRGEYWARLSPTERDTTVAVLQEIKMKGRTLASVWADWQRWQMENNNTAIEPMAYEKAVDEWGRRKRAAGKTERYVYHAEEDLMKFGKGREKQPIHEIRAAELEAYIDSQKTWGLSSKRTNMSLFSSLWNVAIAKGWCSQNIVGRLEPVGKLGRVVEIYPNETTLNLMAAAMHNEVTQKVIAPLSLGFFGCMRPEEIQSAKAIDAGLPKEKWFGWHDIDLKHGRITVRVEIAKTGDQRTIRLQPCAVEWLKLAKELGCLLPPENETRLVDQCCELIGLEDWIRDGLRKNCATHLRAVYKNDYDVVKDCGNSIRILLKHYADLHTPEEVSLEHWEITPEAVKKYIKTAKWDSVMRTAAAKAVIDAAEAPAGQSASGTSTPER